MKNVRLVSVNSDSDCTELLLASCVFDGNVILVALCGIAHLHTHTKENVYYVCIGH